MSSSSKNLKILKEFSLSSIKIQDHFWTPRLQRNQEVLLIYQYNQLERTGCIDNFRILAGIKDGVRKGFFFSDSDAYKWAEAAAISLNMLKNQELLNLLENFIEIIEKAQHNDGYLYTYNQINFKNRRWSNLPMEHELYCMGHLIEAGIAHFIATNSKKFLNIAIKSGIRSSITPVIPKIFHLIIELSSRLSFSDIKTTSTKMLFFFKFLFLNLIYKDEKIRFLFNTFVPILCEIGLER